MCNALYGLSALVGCWPSVFIRRIIYKFLNVSFWLHSFCGKWEGWDRMFNHTSWVAAVAPSDRPVRYVCLSFSHHD